MIESHLRGPYNNELMSKKKPHEMNEEEQRELLEHLTRSFPACRVTSPKWR
jgi:hypothetical protein